MLVPIIVFVVVLAGILGGLYFYMKSKGQLPAIPLPASNNIITAFFMTASSWTIGPIIGGKSDSPGMPTNPNPEATGWGFDFPPTDGVHYVTTAVAGALVSTAKNIVAKFTLTGTGTLVPVPASNDQGTGPCLGRLYMQRRNDDWSGAGPMASYRFWYSGAEPLLAGDHTVTAPLDWTKWTNVVGNTDQAGFAAAIADLENVGITFGRNFAGHGVMTTNGPMHFSMTGYALS